MKNKKNISANSKSLSKIIVQFMLDKKATDIKILYVEKLTSLTDVFIICTSNSGPQAKAITNHIKEELEIKGIKPIHIEGYEQLNWVLMDYISVTINIFNQEYRDYYNIERLWADGKVTLVSDKK